MPASKEGLPPWYSVVKNLPANTGDKGSIPGQEGPVEEEMATLSSILTWRIPWTQEPGGSRPGVRRESKRTR